MRRMSIDIGSLRFDYADYDADNDVLYLHVGGPRAGEGGGDARGPRRPLRAGY